MTFKAENQIVKEIKTICKRYGLEQSSFAFVTKGRVFIMGDATPAFLDKLSFFYLNKSLKKYGLKEH